MRMPRGTPSARGTCIPGVAGTQTRGEGDEGGDHAGFEEARSVGQGRQDLRGPAPGGREQGEGRPDRQRRRAVLTLERRKEGREVAVVRRVEQVGSGRACPRDRDRRALVDVQGRAGRGAPEPLTRGAGQPTPQSRSCQVQTQTSLPSTSARTQNDRAWVSLTSRPPASRAAATRASVSS